MPTFESTQQDYNWLRIRVYGYAKLRKTWWAGTAAEAGFNVLHLSAERGGHGIFKHLSPAARKRIFVLDCSEDRKSVV